MRPKSIYGTMQDDALVQISPLQLKFRRNNLLSYNTAEQLNHLLSLSNDSVKSRSLKELADRIQSPLKKLFYISHFAVVIFDQRKTRLIYSPGNNEDHASMADLLTGIYHIAGSLSDDFLQKVINSHAFCMYGPKEIKDHIYLFENLNHWLSDGFKNVFGISLCTGDEVYGIILMQPMDASQMDAIDYDIARSVSSHVALAVSNIRSIEEIQRREIERELLLSLNSHISAARGTDQLLQIISDDLKKLLGFTHTLIGTANDDGFTASAFLLDPNSAAKNHPVYLNAKSERYPIDDGYMNKSAAQEYPILFDLDDAVLKTEVPLYIKLNYESGIRYMVISRFCKDDQVFGFWMIFFEKDCCPSERSMRLIDGISNQISIAVSNIRANDEIARREKEKSTLLNFSNDLASFTKKNILEKVIKKQLSDLFGIENFSMYAISQDRLSHRVVLSDPDADFYQFEVLENLVRAPTQVSDSVFNHAVLTGKVDFLKMGRPCKPETASLRHIFQDPPTLIAIPIKIENEVIGILSFTSNDSAPEFLNGNLFKSICSQLAISLANLEAREAAKVQLLEINRSKIQLEDEKVYLKEEIETIQNSSEIIGGSAEMANIFKLVSQVAYSTSTVLLLGETGTGKELIARAIHNASPRKEQLMVKVNCAALPANLIESELFGHERGSFTGATDRRIGKFELANNGTLFLDEIGEMPLDLQVKLLRALQEREIERIGGKGPIKVNVRIIAATNRDLEKEMEEGRFRSDLFYRLNIFPIGLPALRDRKTDIPELALFFLNRFAKRSGKKINGISKKAMQDLMEYSWPLRSSTFLVKSSLKTLKYLQMDLI
jgi:formate hydrogenlyase transcriptional activator